MKKIWEYTLLLAGVLAAAGVVNQVAQDPSCGILYRISGGKNEMYLLGSIHVGTKDMYPMGTHIQDVMKRSDVLVFECDTFSPEAAAATAHMMNSDIPLQQKIGEDCLKQVELAAAELGYSMDALSGLKPWAVTSTFTLAAAAREMETGRQTASAYGVENMVRRQAAGKTMVYLETAEEQLNVMEAFSPALQEYLLKNACQAVLEPQKLTGTDADIENWPSWWKAGDAQAFAASYERSLAQEASPELAQEYHQALMTERNRRMALRIQEMLESPEPHVYMATVGLMHLVLPSDSILTQLEKMGYQAEQIKQ